MANTNAYRQEIMNDIKTGMNLITGDEYKEDLCAIADITAEILTKTLGPYAHTTIIDDGTFTYPTKDGYNIISRIHFGDPLYQTLYDFIRKISFSLVSKVGDGTTTAIVAANEFIKEFSKLDMSDYRQSDFIDILNELKDDIISVLKNELFVHYIDMMGDFSDIKNIAYTSSNGNELVSSIIQQIYQQTNNPNIYVEISPDKEVSYEIELGYKFDCKLLNHRVYINTDDRMFKNKTEAINVAIFDHNVTYVEHGKIIQTIISESNQMGKMCAIFAPYFDNIMADAIKASLSHIKSGQIPTVMLIQYPLSTELHRNYIKDFAVLTESDIFDISKVKIINNFWKDDKDENLESLGFDMSKFSSPEQMILGSFGTVTDFGINDKYCIINNYNNENPMYLETLKEAKDKYEELKAKTEKSSTTLSHEFMDAHMRYSKLTGKMGKILVGGESDLEKLCMKDSIDDATLACKSAYENGYVKGLNLAIIGAIRLVADNYKMNMQDTRIQEKYNLDSEKLSLSYNLASVLYATFFNTSLKVMYNKHPKDYTHWKSNVDRLDYVTDNRVTADVILKNADLYNFGYNIVTEEFENADNLSVINSVSADIEILNAVISILSLILTSNQLLSINRLYDKKAGRAQILDEKADEYAVILKKIAPILKDIVGRPPMTQPINVYPMQNSMMTGGCGGNGHGTPSMNYTPTSQTPNSNL